jgi:hypothetical protein
MFFPVQRSGLHPAAIAFATEMRTSRDRALKVLRDQCTQSKGAGAPSLFDAGPVLAELRNASTLQQLKEPFTGSPEMVLALQSVQQRQLRAAQTVWSEVRALLSRVNEVLSPSEELGGAMAALDKLIESAHSRGRLPSHDSRLQYNERRKAVDDSAMVLYRRLSELRQEPIEASSLWNVAIDPTPSLRSLYSYSMIASELLQVIELDLAALDSGPQTGDRSRLDRAFRGLADCLDRLENDL